MLKAEGDWDDGNGGVADKSSQAASTRRSSGTISPMAGQSSRKKMTLNDYKKKVGQAGMKLSPSGNVMPKPQEKISSIAVSVEKEVLPAKDGSSQGQKR